MTTMTTGGWSVFILLFLAATCNGQRWTNNHCAEDRTVIVHLFMWKWTDIALECERFLGPKGFCGVQISPPNEHRLVSGRPWWERYQPVSYLLESSSGTRDQFVDMVQRCNAVNVRIYPDAVINHMVGDDASEGYGSAGSYYSTVTQSFPGVPYSQLDFNCCHCSMCTSSDCNIQNYNDVNQVRNCRLLALLDLALGEEYVRDKTAGFMNDLIDIGVAGFRVDACKHMWPGDMEQVWGRLHDLNADYFGSGLEPFIAQEVIDRGGEPITADQYFHLGRVTEFKFCDDMGDCFNGWTDLVHLKSYPWDDLMASNYALVFVDNHDNQRDHGGGGNILTHQTPKEYKLATAFTLANPYGMTRIMSSYAFTNSEHGPPMTDGSIDDIVIESDDTCGGTWVCEHRWRQIYNMVKFRNVAGGEGGTMDNWWDNGRNQIAFSRGSQAFIAFNTDTAALSKYLQTGMPEGIYCNVIEANLENGQCVPDGHEIWVDGDGYAYVYIDHQSEDPVIAIHRESLVDGTGSGVISTPSPGPTDPPMTGVQRTVIFLHAHSEPGQDVFIRGGVDHDYRPGCTEDITTSPCAISIAHNSLGTSSHYDKYNAWRVGDTKLDWYGAEAGQGTYQGQQAEGTPLAWTTDEPGDDGYQPENSYGEHYWMVDLEMNCDDSENDWFELKGFATNMDLNGGWEGDINQSAYCGGTAGGAKPHGSVNHMGRCGYTNVFEWNTDTCQIYYH